MLFFIFIYICFGIGVISYVEDTNFSFSKFEKLIAIATWPMYFMHFVMEKLDKKLK